MEENSYLGLRAIFIACQPSRSKDHVASPAFEEVTPESDVKRTARRQFHVSFLELNESVLVP